MPPKVFGPGACPETRDGVPTPWMTAERFDDYTMAWKCELCSWGGAPVWATEGHVRGAKHIRNLSYYSDQWLAEAPINQPAPINPPPAPLNSPPAPPPPPPAPPPGMASTASAATSADAATSSAGPSSATIRLEQKQVQEIIDNVTDSIVRALQRQQTAQVPSPATVNQMATAPSASPQASSQAASASSQAAGNQATSASSQPTPAQPSSSSSDGLADFNIVLSSTHLA